MTKVEDREELVQTRKQLLKQMNSYILDKIGDDECTAYWLSDGIPDEPDESDYRFIAENDDQWYNVCTVFGMLITDFDS